jgi:hypothetical protein
MSLPLTHRSARQRTACEWRPERFARAYGPHVVDLRRSATDQTSTDRPMATALRLIRRPHHAGAALARERPRRYRSRRVRDGQVGVMTATTTHRPSR